MKFKVSTAILASVLLAGCQTSPTDGEGNMSEGPAIPGSAEDFRQSTTDRVHFDLNKTNIRDDQKSVVAGQAAWLNQYPNVKVKVEGHADERGGREMNQALGNRRAENTKKALKGHGVDGARVETVSFGKDVLPAGSGNHDSNRVAITKPE